jgi:hypothetical protein
VPKLASGRIPPLAVQQGASAMTSAEEFAAPLSAVPALGHRDRTIATVICSQCRGKAVV